MVMTLEKFNGMQLIWDDLPKSPDENHVTLTINDIDAMWHLGIVDTGRFNLETWRRAFDSHKEAGGTYLLKEKEFLAKETYRYKGEIMVPFDAMKINEGKYTDEGLQELFNLSILPSSSLPSPELSKFLTELKNEFREADSLIKIDSRAKFKIKALLDTNPSPLRRLEILFDNLIKEAAASGQIPTQPVALAKAQSSTFSLSAISEAEIQGQKLSKLEKKSAPKELKKEGGVELKKVKRSRKGMRG